VGNGLSTTIKYLRGAAVNGLGTAIEYLQRTNSGTAGNDLGTTMKYLRRTTSSATGSGLSRYLGLMNTASKLGPHTQTDRGTCPGVGL
jgi:hypothetical protein